MVSADIVKIFDLVYPDDPVLAGEGLLERIEDWALVGNPDTTDTVRCSIGREKGGIVVVGHLVPVSSISHV